MQTKATQANNTNGKSVCRKQVDKKELIMEGDTSICLFKRVKCAKEEWEEIDDAVEDSEIDLEEMLDQWSKVMEGYYRRENKAKQMNTIGEKDINKMFSNNKTREGKSSDELPACQCQ